MATENNNPDKLAFVSHCLPGSLAEQKEKERLAEFHRRKATQQAEEERNRQQLQGQREQEYLDACQANKERMQRSKAGNPLRGVFRMP
jgi:hypothetical protein